MDDERNNLIPEAPEAPPAEDSPEAILRRINARRSAENQIPIETASLLERQEPPRQAAPSVTAAPATVGQTPPAHQPPLTGQTPLAGQQPFVGQTPVTGKAPVTGQTPLTGKPPVTGQTPLTGKPPVTGQTPLTGKPSVTGQTPLTGKPSVTGQPPVAPRQEAGRAAPVPPQGQAARPASPAQGAAAYREYMQRANRPSVYTDEAADDAYQAAYKEAMRRAAGEKAPGEAGRRSRFAVGVIVVLFALFGLGCAVFFGVKGVSTLTARREERLRAQYTERLIAVAAVDPASFDDLSAASMEDLVQISVWSLIGSGFDPNLYTYANGELCIPASDVEAAYARFFGAQQPVSHCSVEGYGYQIKYSAEDGAYYIPMTTLEPLYTPKVISVESKGGATVVVCGMINDGAWTQDRSTGAVTEPEPDKYVRVTFRSASGAEYISSIQSQGLPETAIPSTVPAGEQPAQTEPAVPETTTEKQIVITWD